MRLPMLLFTALLLVATTQSNAQTTYTFKVNSQAYTINEDQLDMHFGKVFDQLVTSGVTKQKNFNLWSVSYRQWKTVVKSCPLQWRLYGKNVAELQSGNCDITSPMARGLGQDGKTAKGNPNTPDNYAKRISYLNALMTKSLSESIIESLK